MSLESKYTQILEQTEEPVCKSYTDGTKRWFLNGKLHRLDGPAVMRPDGTEKWYKHGRPHREGGPAITRKDGTKEWWVDGKLHRLDGPAVEYSDGREEWFVNHKLHRLDGPAVVPAGGEKQWESWWLNGKRSTKEDVEAYRKLLNTSKELGVDLDI